MTLYYEDDQVTLLLGDTLDVLRTMPAGSVDCIVTSPPYFGLRNYGTPGQYGLESTPAEYVETMRSVFAEARRVLADDGTLWLNLGDSYAYPPGSAGRQDNGQREDRAFTAEGIRGTTALPPKNLLGMPWRTAFALQDDGWILRNEIIWSKPNAMPESVTDRLSGRHEHLFLLTKQQRYWFDLDAIREPHAPSSLYHQDIARARPHDLGKTGPAKNTGGVGSHKRGGRELNAAGANPGDVWSISTRPFPAAHFATFPIDLPIRCIKAGCKPGGTVLDPFSGSGTTGAAARQLDRPYIGIDLNPAYHDLAKDRFAQGVLSLDA
ncbi:site-specific DNA-methyltransferase [Streptomyces sp. H10-C2]|uniref:DNA-methyltransferase n=1 Tax=unclassified Streptomyces TaxID=2593676 RepID=UPI0024B8899A|nr:MULTISPECIES: site-specific DNA-methyltransferase [unclassified Streptomyces]MDJ0342195.1 site-specific DNA-methyltransferase [Streptomyces sp. PH10-H1]MDJ0368709.1 site-specific DNA-methyltransferase [Streptomyces sp. H10-C2]